MSNTDMHPLLVPRIRVKADYPNSPFKVGDILHEEKNVFAFSVYAPAHLLSRVNGENVYLKLKISKGDIERYPHLFELLPWWAERSVEEMPEYLKDNTIGTIVIKVDRYVKISEEWWFISEANASIGHVSSLRIFIPATKDEYDNYIKSKQ